MYVIALEEWFSKLLLIGGNPPPHCRDFKKNANTWVPP
jgi:hypothetical protein